MIGLIYLHAIASKQSCLFLLTILLKLTVGVSEVNSLGETVGDPAFSTIDSLCPSLNVYTPEGLPGCSTWPCSTPRTCRDRRVHDVWLAAGNAISLAKRLISHVCQLELAATIRVVLPFFEQLVIFKPILFDLFLVDCVFI